MDSDRDTDRLLAYLDGELSSEAAAALEEKMSNY